MPFDASVRAYLRAYQNEYRAALHGGQHTAELSFRVPMHEMFRRIAHDLNPAGTFDIILEPRNQGRMGRPDWRIQDRISLGVYGYIEAKGPSNEPFDTTPYRDQINRYLTLGHKLIITDGIDFVFCFTETPVVVSIIDKARMDALDWSRLPVDPLFRFYMEQFFSNPAPQRVDEEKLVELVAIRTRNLADEIRGYSDLTIEEAMNEDEHHMLIDKIAEEHRHKSRYSTGEAIGRASKSRGRATTCAANDKTVTNISSDCTSHQEKDTAGSTHGKIPVKGGRIAAAIPPDAEHRYKINRNNNDDRSQHSDFLSFLHHAEAQ